MTAALVVSTFPDVLQAVVPELEAHEGLFEELSMFSSELVPQRFDEVEEETTALVRFVELYLRVLDALGDRWVSVLRIARDRQLDSLILAEIQSVDAEQKLALRHLQTAAEVFGDLVEFVGALFEGLPPEPVAGKIQQVYGSSPLVEIVQDPDGRLVFEWLLALLVGNYAANSDEGEDVSFWAHRALTASRRVKTVLTREARVLRGTRARLEADFARSDWDDEEIEAEKQSWQDL